MSKNAVAPVNTGSNLPAAFAEELMADAGNGLSNITTDDVSIPFLRVVQSGSPQVKKSKPEYNENAKEGMIVNTATGQLWNDADGVTVIPVAFNFKLIEWRDRDTDGGGFVASYARGDADIPQTTQDAKGREVTKDGTYLVPTAEHYVVIMHEDGTTERAVIAMSSTQLKYSRKWNTLMTSKKVVGPNGPFTPPSYAYMYKLTTVPESNDNGDWSSWKIEDAGMIDNRDVYLECRQYAEAVGRGTVQAKHQAEDIGDTIDQETGEVM